MTDKGTVKIGTFSFLFQTKKWTEMETTASLLKLVTTCMWSFVFDLVWLSNRPGSLNFD